MINRMPNSCCSPGRFRHLPVLGAFRAGGLQALADPRPSGISLAQGRPRLDALQGGQEAVASSLTVWKRRLHRKPVRMGLVDGSCFRTTRNFKGRRCKLRARVKSSGDWAMMEKEEVTRKRINKTQQT
jgi:hypothetical protein